MAMLLAKCGAMFSAFVASLVNGVDAISDLTDTGVFGFMGRFLIGLPVAGFTEYKRGRPRFLPDDDELKLVFDAFPKTLLLFLFEMAFEFIVESLFSSSSLLVMSIA